MDRITIIAIDCYSYSAESLAYLCKTRCARVWLKHYVLLQVAALKNAAKYFKYRLRSSKIGEFNRPIREVLLV